MKEFGVSTQGRLLFHLAFPLDHYYPKLILSNIWIKSKATTSIGITSSQHRYNMEFILYPEKNSFSFNTNVKMSDKSVGGIMIKPNKDMKDNLQSIIKMEYKNNQFYFPFTIYELVTYPYSRKSQSLLSLYSIVTLNGRNKAMIGLHTNNNIELGYNLLASKFGIFYFSLQTKPALYSISWKKQTQHWRYYYMCKFNTKKMLHKFGVDFIQTF